MLNEGGDIIYIGENIGNVIINGNKYKCIMKSGAIFINGYWINPKYVIGLIEFRRRKIEKIKNRICSKKVK